MEKNYSIFQYNGYPRMLLNVQLSEGLKEPTQFWSRIVSALYEIAVVGEGILDID